ncbi:myb-like protein X isoform X3 [Venturia canescens]|uniref:myb-like protein X isoform X3 n=1 Tax=Venturia canescens TaxID=32260 RepID=UPI001C9BEDAA|nr:myb-like protein X isoform X3 [Venturia canescens]
MAELITKKSSKIVSNNSNMKNNDVCSVQSNNGLIDLDNITASNNQLITLCDETEDDDDLIMTRNTKNELSPDDKSLQEMIESELALRINSVNENDDLLEDEEEEDAALNQPEVTIKKIIIEPRPDPLDINAEFIGAEMEHYTIVEDPYTYRNGHASPGFAESRSPETVDDETLVTIGQSEPKREEDLEGSIDYPIDLNNKRSIDGASDEFNDSRNVRPDDDVVEDEIIVQSESEPTWSNSMDNFISNKVSASANPAEQCMFHDDLDGAALKVDKHRQEEDDPRDPAWLESEGKTNDQLVSSKDQKNSDFPGVWLDPVVPGDTSLGQFSDDFDSAPGREKKGSEVEEPQDQERQDFEVKADLEENFSRGNTGENRVDFPVDVDDLIDAKTDLKIDSEVTVSGENHSDLLTDNIVEVDPVIEEAENISGSCHSADSSQIEALPIRETILESQKNDEILTDLESNVQCFINEESRSLVHERDETTMKPEATIPETKITGEEEREDVEKDVPGFTENVKSYVVTEHPEENEEREESSWMTVEEATNDRNKLAETINELKTLEAKSGIANESKSATSNGSFEKDESHAKTETSSTEAISATAKITSTTTTNTTTTTTNGLVDGSSVAHSEINFIPDEDEDDSSSCNPTKIDSSSLHDDTTTCLLLSNSAMLAPLATPDDEISEFSNLCDNESREEVITSSSVVVNSTTSAKSSTKTKKKKIEGVAGNDASPTLTPRTKKTKKSKKSDLEKENISVTQSYVSETSRGDQEKSNKEVIETGVSIKQLCRSFGDISNMTDVDQSSFGMSEQTSETQEKAKSMDDLRLCQRDYSKLAKEATVFVGVSVKALRASYCSLANLTRGLDEEIQDRSHANRLLKFEKSSFNKFDALSKKSVLHVRSSDPAKVQQQLNSVGQNGDANPNCRSCGKVVFQMEQTKAEGLVWHKNCFRCVQCSKQLSVDNYQSHESTLYCKAHFKELFQPKPVEESDQPVRPRKPEMIIRENQPKELPPDVVRASDKPDLGLEELSALNVKSRFQVFEKTTNDTNNEIERSPSQVVKRSPSILSKLAKFQAKGMDIGVADDSLNGIPYEESSESEEEEEIEDSEDMDNEIVKAKRTTRERPISFTKMDDIKNRWECTSQQGRRESQREARKEEIAGIRSRLFMGKQGKMKEMYQQAVAESERITKAAPTEEIQHSTHARSIKERFERGEPIAPSDGEAEANKLKQEKPDEEVIAAGISRKSRSLFLELDASAAKTGRPVTPVNPKTPTDVSRRARDAFMGRQVSDDVVRSTDQTEEVQVETSDITNKFKFFETYREPAKERKTFRITPPREDQVKMSSPDREIYRDPDVVRADDRVNEVVRTDTARKMLSIFRQMEEKATKEDIPDGPKPLKCFTPPPEDKFAKATASASEDEEDEEGEETEDDESAEERDPNYVRASDKVEDEFLKQAKNAARAKTLRAKFEQWETTDGKVSSHHVAEMDMAQGNGDQASIESASSLRARFESLGSQPAEAPRAQKVKVNRFVEIQTICMDVCESCQKKVYPLEKVETNNKIFHKQCFRCLQCNCVLRMDTFTLNNGKLYCIPHFKQLFIARGNYDEGFGVDPHKNKWTTTTSTNSVSPPAPAPPAPTPAPIAVANGGAFVASLNYDPFSVIS